VAFEKTSLPSMITFDLLVYAMMYLF